MTHAARRRPLGALLCCASVAAVALGLGAPQKAHAQAFQGLPTVTSGDASVSTGANTTDVLVNSDQVVIDWKAATTGSGAIDFLPAGATATFQNDLYFTGTTFTVLNRILPVDPLTGAAVNQAIAFNGTVRSQINGVTAGNVWFYSPGGIIAGPTSVFNVGSLVLTTDPIDTTGGLYGTNGEIRFSAAPTAGASIQIQPGAQINALMDNSYVAMVSPRIEQGGNVQVNGSTAYVAAEQADITINNGLFDIQIGVGTSDPNGVVHTGTTGGPATTSAADIQRVYMIAMPKNTALTMLLSGAIGYTPATVATEEAGSVVLSAGANVAGGSAVRDDNATADAGITISDADFSSALNGYATNGIAVSADGGQQVSFERATTLMARNSATISATNGDTVEALGDLVLTAGYAGTGGTIDVTADGAATPPGPQSTIGVTGQMRLDASAKEGEAATLGANAVGGAINLTANNGTITAGALIADATAASGFGTDHTGNATGGSISFAATGDGAISIPDLDIDASARVPDTNVHGLVSLAGGAAKGGSTAIAADGGTLDFANVVLAADATGGAGAQSSGDAVSGTIAISVADSSNSWQKLTATADAQAGTSSSGGIVGTASGSDHGFTLGVGTSGTLAITRQLSADTTGTIDLNPGTPAYSVHAQSISLKAGGDILSAMDTVLKADAGILISANGKVSLGKLQAGSTIGIQASDAITSGALIADTDIALSAGGNITTGPLTAETGYIEAAAGGSVSTDSAVAATDAILSASTGSLLTGDVTAGDDVWLGVYNGTPADTVKTGTITVTGQGNDSAISSLAQFSTLNSGAGPTGHVVHIIGPGEVAAGAIINTTGRTIAVADQGAITTGNLTAANGIALLGHDAIATGSVTTSGLFYIGDASMSAPNLSSAYDIAALGNAAAVRTSGMLTLGGPVSVGELVATVGNNTTVGTVVTTGKMTINSNGTLTGDSLDSGAPAVLTGQRGVAFNAVTSHDALTLQALDGPVTVASLAAGGAVTAGGTAIDIASPGALTVTSANASSGDLILTTAGDLTIASGNANGTLALTSGGTIAGQALTADVIRIVAAGNATLRAASATNGLTVSAADTATFLGIVTARAIAIGSGDIAVGRNARLETSGATGSIDLTSTNTTHSAIVGGGEDGGGYTLSASEISRLFANNINIAVPALNTTTSSFGAATPPDVIVRDLAIEAGGNGNIAATGQLTLNTLGNIRVEGAITLAGLAPSGGLNLSAGNAIEVIAGAGSLDLRDSTGDLSGTLNLSAADVIAATDAATVDVATASTLPARDARLSKNDGLALSDGMIRAGTLNLTVSDGAFIQNSGVGSYYDQRRGFTANAIAINTANPEAQLVLNGQLTSPTTPGGFAQGLAVIALLGINGVQPGAVGSFDPSSTTNGCLIVSAATCTPPGETVPTHDELTGETGLDTSIAMTLQSLTPLIAFPAKGLLRFEGQAMGAGNDGLSITDCHTDDTVSHCNRDTTQP